jgi:hypothetical protein
VDVSASLGINDECAGSSSTSSNVRPTGWNFVMVTSRLVMVGFKYLFY